MINLKFNKNLFNLFLSFRAEGEESLSVFLEKKGIDSSLAKPPRNDRKKGEMTDGEGGIVDK
ncbi:hypothetical protein TISLANDTSLP1_08320 [Thermodesulfovibrio yellowstonii]|uniref:Uncharacterized protein n=1 Tax=Thermodesulfovibrio yellowstonii TaxID=28262 RepID=A0A9W6GDB4_9BACT|nr:hypothetical protein TISLANDTSLP1_08320 [Thermodesulfovibrio islandicus]